MVVAVGKCGELVSIGIAEARQRTRATPKPAYTLGALGSSKMSNAHAGPIRTESLGVDLVWEFWKAVPLPLLFSIDEGQRC